MLSRGWHYLEAENKVFGRKVISDEDKPREAQRRPRGRGRRGRVRQGEAPGSGDLSKRYPCRSSKRSTAFCRHSCQYGELDRNAKCSQPQGRNRLVPDRGAPYPRPGAFPETETELRARGPPLSSCESLAPPRDQQALRVNKTPRLCAGPEIHPPPAAEAAGRLAHTPPRGGRRRVRVLGYFVSSLQRGNRNGRL